MKQLPHAFMARMEKILGGDFPAFLNSYNEPPVKSFRVNTRKISISEFEKICDFSCGKIPYCETGFYTDIEKPGNHPFHHAGMIYMQDPAAMAPAECVDIDHSWHILDMCAAPGGKSSRLAEKIPKGVLVSNEIIPSRCKILTGNIERLGFQNTVTTCMDTNRLADIFENTFDLVMVDAPCSGEGMFRKDDTAIAEWSQENVLMCAQRQAEILDNAALCVKSGGYIIYATCTFSLEENEITVDNFLSRHSNFKLVPVNQAIKNCTAEGIKFEGAKNDTLNLCRRFYPHLCKGEGQFMAVLKNTNEPSTYYHKKQQIPSVPNKAVFDFLDSVLEDYKKEKVILHGDTPVYFNPDFLLSKGTAFSCGVKIGEVVKNRVVPHHQFFMALGHRFKIKIDLKKDSPELLKYLHGEEIDVECQKNGWGVITVNGCTVGGVKVVGGRAKNHYPKGLRTKI